MVYIKLENDMDKFMVKYKNLPKTMKKITFKSRCRIGKFKIEKCGNSDYIILPELNNNVLKKLKNMAKVKCWKNICVSDDLRENNDFIKFSNENNLKIMDGKWLFKNIISQVVEYIADYKNELLVNQEISILCNHLDETIIEKIKEICIKVKVCNVLTNNIKQYQKLEEQIYQTNGIILNISNNYKKAIAKSNIIINFDFTEKDLEKCIFHKNSYIVNIGEDLNLDKKAFLGKNIALYETNMPKKYMKYKEILKDFKNNVLYESFIYKNTNYKNIKKEIEEDNLKIEYLEDYNNKKLVNLSKKLDKIVI